MTWSRSLSAAAVTIAVPCRVLVNQCLCGWPQSRSVRVLCLIPALVQIWFKSIYLRMVQGGSWNISWTSKCCFPLWGTRPPVACDHTQFRAPWAHAPPTCSANSRGKQMFYLCACCDLQLKRRGSWQECNECHPVHSHQEKIYVMLPVSMLTDVKRSNVFIVTV